MASIVWRADRGKWYAYFYRNGKQTGTPLKAAPSRKVLTKAERANAAAEAEAIASTGPVVPVSQMDIDTAAGQWLSNCVATCAMRTVERYRTTAASFIRTAPDQERTLITAITSIHVRTFRDARMKDHAASTVINDLKCLSTMFAWLRKQRLQDGARWIPENPCEDVEHPRREQRKAVFPTDEEVRRLVGLLDGQSVEFRALGLLGAFAGMRRNEIIMLHWEWVDMDAGLIYAHGKSKWPRPIPMHPRVKAFLNVLPRDGDMVLPSPYAATGQMRSPYAAWKFNEWLGKQGFAWTHHGLRRWFNDSLRKSPQLSSSARQLVLGHEDEATNRLYQNPQAEEARPFVEALEP